MSMSPDKVVESREGRHRKAVTTILRGTADKSAFPEKKTATASTIWSWCPSTGKLQVEEEGQNEGNEDPFASVHENESGGSKRGGSGGMNRGESEGRSFRSSTLEENNKFTVGQVETVIDNCLFDFPRNSRRGSLRTTGVETRSVTAEMRRAVNSSNGIKEGAGKNRTGKRPLECFVPWKKVGNSNKEAKKAGSSQGLSNGTRKKNDIQKSSTSFIPNCPPSGSSVPLSRTREDGRGIGRQERSRQHHSGNTEQSTCVEGHTAVPEPQEKALANETVEDSDCKIGGRVSKLRSGKQPAGADYVSPSKNMSTMSERALQEEIFTRNREYRFAVLEDVREREKQQPCGTKDCAGPQKRKKSSPAKSEFIDEEEIGEESKTPPRMEDEEDVLADNDKWKSENRRRIFEARDQSTVTPLRLGNEDVDEIGDTDNEEDTYNKDEVEERTEIDVEDGRDFGDFRYRTDAERKKGDRKELYWTKREKSVERKACQEIMC